MKLVDLSILLFSVPLLRGLAFRFLKLYLLRIFLNGMRGLAFEKECYLS